MYSGPTLYPGRGRASMVMDQDYLHSAGWNLAKLNLNEGGLSVLNNNNEEGKSSMKYTFKKPTLQSSRHILHVSNNNETMFRMRVLSGCS